MTYKFPVFVAFLLTLLLCFSWGWVAALISVVCRLVLIRGDLKNG